MVSKCYAIKRDICASFFNSSLPDDPISEDFKSLGRVWEVESGLVCGEESIFSSSSVCDLPAADEAVSLGMMTLLTVAAVPGEDAAGLMHTIRALLPAADPDDGCWRGGVVDGALLVVRDILVNGWLSVLVVLPPGSARTVCSGMSASRSNIPASCKINKNKLSSG